MSSYRGELHLERSKFCGATLATKNLPSLTMGSRLCQVPFTLTIGADFADIFEVRGMLRQKRGQRLDDRIREGLRYFCPTRGSIIKFVRLAFYAIRLRPIDLCIGGAVRPQSSARERGGLPSLNLLRLNCCSGIGWLLHRDCFRRTRAQTDSETFRRLRVRILVLATGYRRSVADVQMMITGNPEANYPYAGVRGSTPSLAGTE